jgi:hypothetical protein
MAEPELTRKSQGSMDFMQETHFTAGAATRILSATSIKERFDGHAGPGTG